MNMIVADVLITNQKAFRHISCKELTLIFLLSLVEDIGSRYFGRTMTLTHFFSGGYRSRTDDPLRARQML